MDEQLFIIPVYLTLDYRVYLSIFYLPLHKASIDDYSQIKGPLYITPIRRDGAGRTYIFATATATATSPDRLSVTYIMAALESPLLGSQRRDHGSSEGEEIRKRPGISGFLGEFGSESRRLWHIAGPAIFTAICQYSLGALTQTFAGQVGELELAAVSVENSVIAGLAFGVMVN